MWLTLYSGQHCCLLVLPPTTDTKKEGERVTLKGGGGGESSMPGVGKSSWQKWLNDILRMGQSANGYRFLFGVIRIWNWIVVRVALPYKYTRNPWVVYFTGWVSWYEKYSAMKINIWRWIGQTKICSVCYDRRPLNIFWKAYCFQLTWMHSL